MTGEDRTSVEARVTEVVNKNCTCEFTEDGEIQRLCPLHTMMDDPERRDAFVSHLEFARMHRMRWIRNEHSEPVDRI